jgi:hypothetical protein
MAKSSTSTEPQAVAAEAPSVQWNDKDMTTHFANVVNVQSSREQVDLFFGMNRTWNLSGNSQITVHLSNQIVLTPLAAKRLWTVLGSVLREYESRYAALDIGGSGN